MRGICDRCGLEYDFANLRKEWTGLMVCHADFDRKPAELRPPRLRSEGLPVPNARPEQPLYEPDVLLEAGDALVVDGGDYTITVDGAFITDEAEDPLWFLR